MELLKNYKFKTFLITAAIFLTIVPVSTLINFYQNDDWAYYLTVQRFIAGNFTLHPYVGPTLYLQAFLGLLFSLVFGISHLPVLTLLMACVSFYFFVLILIEFLNVKTLWAVAMGFLYFFNFLGVYELWGFMTNHYFLALLLPDFYFFLSFDKNNFKKDFYIYALLVFCGLLIRQVSLVMPLTVAVYYFLKKNFKLSAINFGFFVALYAFYSKILPLTPRIREVPLQFERYLNFDYSYAIIYGSLLILVAYTLPLIFNFLGTEFFTQDFKKILLLVIVSTGLFILFNKIYKPDIISWAEFPYFENVLERTGFYPRGVHGTKYHFAGNYDLWKYWDLAAKILVAAFVTTSIYKFYTKPNSNKFVPNLFILFILVYMAIMIATKTFYDRYIHIVVPIFIFYLLSLKPDLTRFGKFMLLIFVLFLGYLSYLFSADFILVNKYIWNRAKQLVIEKNIKPDEILATNAWKLTYHNTKKVYLYNFSHDSPMVNENYKNDYRLIEIKDIVFPLNIFVNPKIYLYEKKL